MNAMKINVFISSGPICEFTAITDRTLRAIVGKHGELRILQIQTLEDLNIETGKQKELHKTLSVFNHDYWNLYENNDSS